MHHQRVGVGALIDDLHQAVVVLVKTIDDVGVELGVGERLANGGKRVGESLDLGL
jgi:hypothetical protein